MQVLVTGSAGHLGEALVRTLRERQHEVAGLDLLDTPFTTHVGSITDSQCGAWVAARVLHKALVSIQSSQLRSAFYLQMTEKKEWTRRDSNS